MTEEMNKHSPIKIITIFVAILFILISIIFLGGTLSELEYSKGCCSFYETLKSIHDKIKLFSGLHNFTLIVVGICIAIWRLELSLDKDATNREITKLNVTKNNNETEKIKLELEIGDLKRKIEGYIPEHEELIEKRATIKKLEDVENRLMEAENTNSSNLDIRTTLGSENRNLKDEVREERRNSNMFEKRAETAERKYNTLMSMTETPQLMNLNIVYTLIDETKKLVEDGDYNGSLNLLTNYREHLITGSEGHFYLKNEEELNIKDNR